MPRIGQIYIRGWIKSRLTLSYPSHRFWSTISYGRLLRQQYSFTFHFHFTLLLIRFFNRHYFVVFDFSIAESHRLQSYILIFALRKLSLEVVYIFNFSHRLQDTPQYFFRILDLRDNHSCINCHSSEPGEIIRQSLTILDTLRKKKQFLSLTTKLHITTYTVLFDATRLQLHIYLHIRTTGQSKRRI